MRRRVPDRYPIRRYPDITHSLQCQYPVPEWDVAFALTHGREGINPRPVAMKRIHNLYKDYAIGSITYSEGINDDVNKFVWADQDWDPDTPVVSTLRDYVRFFVGPEVTAAVSQGLLALEENWQGPLALNGGVETTLQQWQAVATHASQDVLENYRFQMGLLRAYCDAYVHRRLLHETELEEWALDTLRQAGRLGVHYALARAAAILDSAHTSQMALDLRVRLRAWCEQLADALNRTIGLQSSVSRHMAQSWNRGAFLDSIDLPLNDGPWLRQQIAQIRALPDEVAQLVEVETLLHRTDPGPGGRYIDFGAPGSLRRVAGTAGVNHDPGYLSSPMIGFDGPAIADLHKTGQARAGVEAVPLARIRQAATLYDTPLTLRLEHLDAAPEGGAFRLRVAYGGSGENVNFAANGVSIARHGEGCAGSICTYTIPAHLIQDGTLTLIWQAKAGARGVRIAELWLEMEVRS